MGQHYKKMRELVAEMLRRRSLPTDAQIHGAEVGVDRAEMSVGLLKTFPGLRLNMIDPWSAPMRGRPDREQDFQIAQQAVEFSFPRGKIWRMTSEAWVRQTSWVNLFENNGWLDFVFIDGDHSPQAVRWDLENWWGIVKPGGLLAGHDYGTQNGGVKLQVDAWTAAMGLKLYVGRGWVWWVWKGKE